MEIYYSRKKYSNNNERRYHQKFTLVLTGFYRGTKIIALMESSTDYCTSSKKSKSILSKQVTNFNYFPITGKKIYFIQITGGLSIIKQIIFIEIK